MIIRLKEKKKGALRLEAGQIKEQRRGHYSEMEMDVPKVPKVPSSYSIRSLALGPPLPSGSFKLSARRLHRFPR